MWFLWVLGGLAVWLGVALLVALVIGRAVRLADRREPGTGVDDVLTPVPLAVPVRERRRPLPLPPLGIALAALAVALQTVGFVARLAGSSTRAVSMDAPYSVPRLYVAALFAAAALAAAAGAGALPGRRTWWTGVALVAGAVAAVKAGSTVHVDALDWLSSVVGVPIATALSVLFAAAVVSSLWFLSRHDRRDRRRVLGALSGYAAAAVALSAVSSAVPAALAATATYVEESGEALAGVAFLIAVLAGVAPRLVLPASWPLRRTQDAQTLDLPVHAPRTAPGGPPAR